MCNEHLYCARVHLILAIELLDRLGESLAAVRAQEALDVLEEKRARYSRKSRALRH